MRPEPVELHEALTKITAAERAELFAFIQMTGLYSPSCESTREALAASMAMKQIMLRAARN